MNLHLRVFYARGNRQLVQLTAELRNLVEITLQCFEYIDSEIIGELIENHEMLMQFQFMAVEFANEDLDILRWRFEHDDIVQDLPIGWKGLSFERKN